MTPQQLGERLYAEALAAHFPCVKAEPVMRLPQDVHLLDLSKGPYDQTQGLGGLYTIGRYHERRPQIYQTSLFGPQGSSPRFIHMGLDLGAPAETPVYAWADGLIYAQGVLSEPGDYGHSLVTQHEVTLEGERVVLWSLYGHLSAASVGLKRVGERVRAGEVLGALGDVHENGGWPPHLHFQLSVSAPQGHDLPGVVSEAEEREALWRYPDPRLVCGALY